MVVAQIDGQVISRIIIAILSASLAAAMAWGVWASWGMGSLEAENLRLSLALASCQAREINIDQDRKSDATVFDPDFTIPDSWLLPTD